MDDLVYHVAEVYLHKVTIMRAGEWPRAWPPPGLAAEPRLALLARAYGALTGEFARRDPASPTPTWFDLDETVAFWIRRMVQETVVHRMDAELAADLPVTHVPDDLAIDGVDEVLTRFLAWFTPEELVHMKGEHLPGHETIVVTAGNMSWTVHPSATREVVVEEGSSSRPRAGRRAGGRAAAEVRAAPDLMLRWLWGRAGDVAVTVTGDPAWADYLRRMLAATTQ
jgi:MDMPI C-terminal domain